MTVQEPKIMLSVKNLTKKFDRKIIFENVSFELPQGGSLAITGRNGSGKSTLIKTIANVIEKSGGEVNFYSQGQEIKSELLYKYIGFVSPYLNLYDEFTGYENLRIISEIRGTKGCDIDNALKKVGLYERRHDMLKIYSSGMKQRLKIAFSILHNPEFLLLDEPTSNLDSEGVEVVNEIAGEYKKNGILIIATNDEHEKSLCESGVNLDRNA
jgi:heme exporter protein A